MKRRLQFIATHILLLCLAISLPQILSATNIDLVCNNHVNISLDSMDCQTQIMPDLILEGTYPDMDTYTVELSFTENGPSIGDVVTADHIGMTLYARVIDPVSGNLCWGTILVEDKLAPVIICSDIVIACDDGVDPNDIGFPTAFDGCTTVDLTFGDQVENLGCTGPFQTQITRTWTATDLSGNSNSCIQIINVESGDVGSVLLPPNYDGLPGQEDILQPCSNTWDLNNNGYPDYFDIGDPNNEVEGPGGISCGNIQVHFTDLVIDICENGFKVLRSWTILNWCTSATTNHTQIIKVLDTTDPVISAEDITVGVDPWTCLSYGAGLNVQVSDNCTSPSNIVVTTIPSNISDLPIGTHPVQVTATDACGNSSSAIINVNVIDDQPPVTVCDAFTVVSLGQDGLAKLFAQSLDDGSHDCTSQVFFKVRRMDVDECDGINGDDDLVNPGYQEWFDEYAKFCCEDVGNPVTVILRVYDINPTGLPNGAGKVDPAWESPGQMLDRHYNDCMVTVTVQDKIGPNCIAPADVTLDCDDPIDIWDLDPYGTANGQDNCTTVLDFNINDLRECGTGRIIRTWTVQDAEGQTSTCRQIITVRDNDPFEESDILWPNDYELNTCGANELLPENLPARFTTRLRSGTEDNCSLVAITYEDEYTFEIVPDACFKVIRKWTVIDWCTFDLNTGQGIWSRFQVLKVLDDDKPEIVDCPEVITNIETSSGNLIVNGDFNNGLTNFTSDYVEGTGGPFGTLSDEGQFTVASNGADTHNNFAPCTDHTTGTGNMLVVNGAGTMDQKIWCQTVSVETEKDYMFSTWMTAMIAENPPIFQFSINGDFIGDEFNVSNTTCNWQQFQSTWSSPSAMEAEICIVNKNTELSGNDFAIDDISFEKVITCDVRDCEAFISLVNPDADDCVSDEMLNWSYSIDQDNDGTYDITRDGSDASGYYPFGTHKILWRVEDGCGNEETCTSLIELKDCKKPTPYCRSVITVLMPSSGMVELWATDLDIGSFDNCSNSLDFSARIGTTGPWSDNIVFTCNDLEDNPSGIIPVQMRVVDDAGNEEFCTVTVTIQDNGGCDPNMTLISGTISTEDGESIEGTNVHLMNDGTEMMIFTTESNGLYSFPNLERTSNYLVNPENNDNPLNGISTYDLVMIQKHILGVQLLDSPYKVIAADINNSQSVSALDMVELRRMILGEYDNFPSNTSWRFVSNTSVIEDNNQPWPFNENANYENLAQSVYGSDFIGVKIGDVNGSVIPNTTIGRRSARSAEKLDFNVEALSNGDQITVNFKAADFDNVEGFQFGLDFGDLNFIDFKSGAIELSESNFGTQWTERSLLNVSWNNLDHSVQEGSILFSLIFDATSDINIEEVLSLSNRLIQAEAYPKGEDIVGINLNFQAAALANFDLFQNVPNPFANETQIGFQLASDTQAEIAIFDVSGKQIHNIKGEFAKGLNNVTINRNELAGSGVYIFQIITKDWTASKRMVLQ